ncbi:MAG: DUF6624 domain-containing protein [Gemmatimonadales bacterium]
MRWLAVTCLVLALSRVPALRAQQVADPSLRAELLERRRHDQAIRDSFAAELRATGGISPTTGQRMLATDSANTGWLKGIVSAGGWPTRAAVGDDGLEAAFLLVQHADHDPAFQARMLPLLDRAHAVGEVDGGPVALLTDRVAKAQGRPQRYGSQATIRDGRVFIDPIEDSAHVDERRARMGLMPLADYVRILDSVYAKSGP